MSREKERVWAESSSAEQRTGRVSGRPEAGKKAEETTGQ